MANPLLDELENGTTGSITVSLPTGGLFYDDNIMDKSVDVIEAPVKTYTVWEESTFNDPYQIISGKASTNMIKCVAPWVHQPQELARMDMEMIMLGAKLASYGEQIELRVECSNPETREVKHPTDDTKTVHDKVCGVSTTVKVDLREVMGQYPVFSDSKAWQLKVGAHTVFLRPPRIRDELIISREAVEKTQKVRHITARIDYDDFEKSKDVFNEVQSEVLEMQVHAALRLVRSAIMRVRTKGGVDVTDENMIDEWLMAIGTPSIIKIRDKVKTLMEPYRNIGTFDFMCPICSHVTPSVPTVADPVNFFGGGLLGRQTDKPFFN